MSDHISLMYGKDSEPKNKRPSIKKELLNPNSKTRKINVGIVAYDVPTVQYMEKLEKKIEDLEKQLAAQGTRLRRLEMDNSRLKKDTNRHQSSLTQLGREVDNKIDRRYE